MPMVANDFKAEVLPVSKKLFRFAIYLLNDSDKAMDVVQDVFLKLWQKRDELNQINNIEGYAMRITRNRCLDIIRGDRMVPVDNETNGIMKENAADVHYEMELSESAAQIKKLIGRLPGLQRTVMQLRDIEQLTYEEIGELTGLEVNAIRVNLSRARKKVRDEFLKINSDEDRRSKTATAKIF